MGLEPTTLYTLDRALYHLYMSMSNLIATEEERAEREGEGGEEGDRPHSQPSTVEGKALFNQVRTTCTCCLTLLASFFLPSHLSFKNMYMEFHIR